MRTRIVNIKRLVGVDTHHKLRLQGKEMMELGQVENAWLLVEDGHIAAWGTMEEL